MGGHDKAELDRLREQSAMTGGASGEGRLSLRRLVDCAQDSRSMEAGDVRLNVTAASADDEAPARIIEDPIFRNLRRDAMMFFGMVRFLF